MEDLRIIKTKQAIKDAFFSLVEEVGFDNVHIKDVAKRAQINRNTFYLHYESKEDLVQKLANESMLNRFTNMNIESTFKSKNKRRVAAFFNGLMDEIEANIDIYRIYLINPAMAGYLRISTNKVMDKVFTFIKKNDTTKLLYLLFLLEKAIFSLELLVLYQSGSFMRSAQKKKLLKY